MTRGRGHIYGARRRRRGHIHGARRWVRSTRRH